MSEAKKELDCVLFQEFLDEHPNILLRYMIWENEFRNFEFRFKEDEDGNITL
jgi:hypothetical protein